MGTTLVPERIEHGGTRIERFHEGVAVEREIEREIERGYSVMERDG